MARQDDIKPMKFIPESYDENDKIGKDLLIRLLERNGWTIVSSEENYDHDVVAKKNGEVKYFEVEMKSKVRFSSVEDFPYSTVSFLGRKKRLHQKHPFVYMIICKETLKAVTCSSTVIFNDMFLEKINISTEQRQGQDVMYRVPKELCKFIYML